MRNLTARSLAAASLFSLGLVAWPGCNAENPDGTPTTVGKMENKAVEIEHKIEDGAKKAGKVIKEDAAKAVDATGKAIENAGEKLETSGKKAVEDHLGAKAGEIAEGAGKALDKGGEKLQDSVKKKD